MKIIAIYVFIFSICFLTLRSFAAPMPEGYPGVVTKVDARSMTVRGDMGSKVFDIRKAGVCGWPTRKKVPEVFKVGEKVEVYHFSDIQSKAPIPALNVFFSDQAKVEAFQKQESAKSGPGKK